MHDPGPRPDFTRPSGTRIYDYLQGGKDNFAPDRDAADRLEAMFPGAGKLARQQLEFARRAARWLYDEGVSQFIDAGCGLPSPPSVAQVAPCARVAYVDADPVALAHLRALAAGDGIAVAAGDAADPAGVLAARPCSGVASVLEVLRDRGCVSPGVCAGV